MIIDYSKLNFSPENQVKFYQQIQDLKWNYLQKHIIYTLSSEENNVLKCSQEIDLDENFLLGFKAFSLFMFYHDFHLQSFHDNPPTSFPGHCLENLAIPNSQEKLSSILMNEDMLSALTLLIYEDPLQSSTEQSSPDDISYDKRRTLHTIIKGIEYSMTAYELNLLLVESNQ